MGLREYKGGDQSTGWEFVEGEQSVPESKLLATVVSSETSMEPDATALIALRKETFLL